MPLSGAATILIVFIPFTTGLHPLFYSTFMIFAIGLVGSQYAIMPSAITDSFGEIYASENIGYVYYSTVSFPTSLRWGCGMVRPYVTWRSRSRLNFDHPKSMTATVCLVLLASRFIVNLKFR